jgi:flagellin
MRVGSDRYGADLAAQQSLMQAYAQMSLASTRLATMSRINRAADDPAGLIALEQMEAELAAINAASESASRASGMAHVADAGLGEVSSLLNSVRAGVLAAAGGGLSDAEVDAKQMEIDAALEAIDRIGSLTSFGGRNLLEGGTLTFDFSLDASDPVSIELPAVHTWSLGGSGGTLAELASGGSADLASGNFAGAIGILDAVGGQILDAQVRLGAFEKYTIDSTARVLGSMEQNIFSAKSMVGDTDVAVEMSRLVKAEILVSSATATIALANRRQSLINELFRRS